MAPDRDVRSPRRIWAFPWRMLIVALLILPFSNRSLAQDSTRHQQPQRSPGGALIRSAIIPGWGQLYNHRYVKAVIFFGAESYFVYKFYDEHQALDDISGESRRESAKYDRNTWAWRFLAGYVINIADAYVDAHLAGFPEDESLDLNFQPLKKGWLFSLDFSF